MRGPGSVEDRRLGGGFGRRWYRRRSVVIGACAAIACLLPSTLASTATAYESTWEGFVNSGEYLKDTEAWLHGGYHTWLTAGTAHVGGSTIPRVCIWLYNGSSWESGSGCATENYKVLGYFAKRENALAQSQAWSYSGGPLTLVGNAYGP
jgi:hypothetical protein